MNLKYIQTGLLFLFIPLAPFSVAARDFSLSLENRVGLISGFSWEYVYEGDKQISRLEWDEKYTPNINLSFNFAWKGFFVTGAVSASIPAQTRYMRNHDYLLPNSNELTNFSEHDAFLERHNEYNIGAGYQFALGNWRLDTAAGFLYTGRKWTASGGYSQYAVAGKPLTGNEPAENFAGSVITYDQKISWIHVNAGAGYYFSDTLFAGLQLSFYPYFWHESKDHHILRSLEFLDLIQGGMGGSIGLAASYKPSFAENIELTAGCAFELVLKKTGVTGQRTTGTGEEPAFKLSGTHHSAYDSEFWYFFIGVKYLFLF